MTSRTRTGVVLAALVAAGTLAVGLRAGEAGPPRGPVRASAPLAERSSADTTFAGLIARLSGEGAYFDTDNLISNETSYLHVAARLRDLRRPGLAYVGVGPDQNFSYIAALGPEAAFILDIRRDNLLHHLLLKALIEASPDRATFLAALFGRADPPARLRDPSTQAAAILDWVEQTPALAGQDAERAAERLTERIEGFGVDLSDADHETIRRFHDEFVEAGPGLRFRSHGRAPRWYYPTYRELLLEVDESGAPASYVASAEAYETLRDLQLADAIVPVVGDFAGPHALRAIGAEISRRGLRVGAFYTSNVEFYLFRQGAFDRFAESAEALPAVEDAVFVRSYFHRGRPHRATRPGYASTQVAQPFAAFLRAWREGALVRYDALIHGS